MRKYHLILLAILPLACGCRIGLISKRVQEGHCPTDIRQKHCWCWGEDAVFDTPCGVDEAYHGHKPTCWRPWPAPAAVWRDERCGGPPCDATGMAPAATPIIPNSAIPYAPSAEWPEPAPPSQEYIAPEEPAAAPEQLPGAPDVKEGEPRLDASQGFGWRELRHSLQFGPDVKKK